MLEETHPDRIPNWQTQGYAMEIPNVIYGMIVAPTMHTLFMFLVSSAVAIPLELHPPCTL